MKVKILGSGGWEGIPVPFCDCRICKLAMENPNSKNNRNRPEILIESKDGRFLIEISPDIRLQSTKFNLTNIKDFLISHWHFDHLYGLFDLHAWAELINKPKLYCSDETKRWLDKNVGYIPKEIAVLKPYKEFELFGIKIIPLPVYHMFSLDKDLEESKLENTFGFLLKEKNKRLVYLSDYFKIPQKTIDLIKNSDIIIADGTFLFEEQFPNKSEQNGLETDPDHLHGEKIFDLINSLNAKKIVFHSITHLTEKTHEELQSLLPKNMEISFDGMEIKI